MQRNHPADAIIGFSFFVSITSRQITSEAMNFHPGEFTRKTTAFTLSSRRASRNAFDTVSEPMLLSLPSPPLISPEAYTMAIWFWNTCQHRYHYEGCFFVVDRA